MYYSETILLLAKVFRRAAKFKAVPYDWDPVNFRFKVISQTEWGYYFSLLSFSAATSEFVGRLVAFMLWLLYEPQLLTQKDTIILSGYQVYLKFVIFMMHWLLVVEPQCMTRQFNLFLQFSLNFNETFHGGCF
jgi:hypothetical protein